MRGKPSWTLRQAIFQRDQFTCRGCLYTATGFFRARDLTLDHIVPLSAGGLTQADNLQVLCSTCNAIKGTRMPNRMIRESARTSDTLDQLSDGAERMFWRLTTVADDFGRFEADPRVLLSACFPLRAGRLKVEQVAKWLKELVLVELVSVYIVGGKRFGVFTTWEKHQRIRAKHSKFPPPSSDSICQQMPAYVAERRETRDEETERRETRVLLPPYPPPRAEEPVEEVAWGKPEDLVALYNTETPDNVPAVEELSAKRREKALRALRQYASQAWWKEVFAQYRHSRFLRGLVPPPPGRKPFKPDFDWLLSNHKNGVENYVRVHDGVYADG
jgi:HNH endonuclease